MKSVALIANPFAGSRRNRYEPKAAAARLRDVGYEVEILLTEGPGHATQLAGRAAEAHPVVAALGGDGTVHETALGLVGTAAALTVLPCGSGNDFAFGLGIDSVAEGVAVAGRGHRRQLDACALDERMFFNTAGFFLSGCVSGRAVKVWRQAGKWRYVLSAVSSLVSYRPQAARWRLHHDDSERTGKFLLAEVCNGPRAGGGFRLAPAADPFDGVLDFCLIRPVSIWTGLRLLPAAASGGVLEHEAVERVRSSGAVLEVPEAVPMHLDGEPGLLAAGRHELLLKPGALTVLAPPPASG